MKEVIRDGLDIAIYGLAIAAIGSLFISVFVQEYYELYDQSVDWWRDFATMACLLVLCRPLVRRLFRSP